MKWFHWLIIVFLQLTFVVLGLWVYYLFLGGAGMDPGLAITLWAAIITIVFVVFSLIGMKNIDGKISDLEESNDKIVQKYEQIEEKSNELIRSLNDSREKIVKEAETEIKKITDNSCRIQNYYQIISSIESEPKPERRIVMFTDLLSKEETPQGIDKSYLYIKRGLCYMQLGLLEKAKADFDLSLEYAKELNKSSAYASIADYYVRKQDFPKSIEYYRKAIAESPSALLYSDLGNSLNKTKEYKEAEECYDKALAMNPELAGVYYNKSLMMHETTENPSPADYAQMMSFIEKTIAINPMFLPAYINKASLLREQGKEADAIEALDKVLTPMFNDDIVNAIMQRGIANRLTNNHPKALNDFCTVLLHRPHNVQNLCNLALTYLEMGYFPEAGYYAQIGLREANEQGNDTCNGELYKVQQTVLALMRSPYEMSSKSNQKQL